jgi:Uma2 family endonuclease
MPALEQVDSAAAKGQNCRKRWTVAESYKLAHLFPGERYELIEGDLISKMGQNPPHSHLIRMLTDILVTAFRGRVQVQAPIRLPEPDGVYSEPEPDVVLLKGDIRQFADHHPGPDDIALLIEVSDTSLQMDREIKYRLYARAGINEYWIVDIANRRTFVCREPAGDEYKSVTIYDAEEAASTPSAPGFVFSLKALLP